MILQLYMVLDHDIGSYSGPLSRALPNWDGQSNPCKGPEAGESGLKQGNPDRYA